MTERLIKRGIWMAAILILLGAGYFFRPYISSVFTVSTMASSAYTSGERTLIIAPHPDDETLGGAGVIQKAVASGKQVKVVIVTTGDGFTQAVKDTFGVQKPQPADFQRLGELRHKETLQAMQHFGVTAKNVIFLGYPDGGVNQLWESHWDYSQPYQGMNGSARSPYRFSYEKKAFYCGTNLVKNLSDIIIDYKPTDVVYPDPNDSHHDHWGTGAFVKYTLTEQKYQGREWTFLIHHRDFPTPWMYEPELPLTPPVKLQNLDTQWVNLPMDEWERTKKLDAIKKYKSQTKVMRIYLESFVRKNELLGTYHDPSMPAVFHDAKADDRKGDAEPGADIVNVTAAPENQALQIAIETNGPVVDRAMYNIRLRIFRPEGVSRLDLTAQGNKLTARKYAGNSLDVPSGCSLRTDGSRLSVSLPPEVIRGATGILISTDTFIERERIDKTAWRLIRLDSKQ